MWATSLDLCQAKPVQDPWSKVRSMGEMVIGAYWRVDRLLGDLSSKDGSLTRPIHDSRVRSLGVNEYVGELNWSFNEI